MSIFFLVNVKPKHSHYSSCYESWADFPSRTRLESVRNAEKCHTFLWFCLLSLCLDQFAWEHYKRTTAESTAYKEPKWKTNWWFHPFNTPCLPMRCFPKFGGFFLFLYFRLPLESDPTVAKGCIQVVLLISFASQFRSDFDSCQTKQTIWKPTLRGRTKQS